MSQLSFSIRTTANCKTVHLVGSWDGYRGQLPLSPTAKKDAWAGTFRFASGAVREGERYWYYYLLDGYHTAHDPARDSTVESQTGRRLNLLVVKDGKPLGAGKAGKSAKPALTVSVAKGRPVSPSRICAPKPVKPASVTSPRLAKAVSPQQVSEHGSTTVAHLASQLDKAHLSEQVDWDEWSGSEASDSGSDASSRGGARSTSTASSRTSIASSSPAPAQRGRAAAGRCECNRFATTRAGVRVRVDCGGRNCDGYEVDDESDCDSDSSCDFSSSDEESDDDE